MKRIFAGLITIGLLALTLVLSRRPNAPPESGAENSPEKCIERMFTLAEEGNVAGYLDCFTGEERRRLERELGEQTVEAFAQSLQDAVQELKAHVVFAPEEKEPNQVQVTVERVYANRTERQQFHLVQKENDWRVFRIESAQAYQPEVPYGTPVFEMPASDQSR
jgi:hypothetical protein